MSTDALQRHLTAFDALAAPGPYAHARTIHHEGGVHGTHLVFGAMVHGNEVGSLPAVVAVARALADGSLSYGGKVTFFLGNVEAGLQDERFLDSDLNRVFVDDPPDDHEGRRACDLKAILDDADVFLDLHQTILPSEHRFWIAPFQTEAWHWVRALQATPMWVTRSPGTAFSSGTMCADEYVRNRRRPGITLELGAKGFGHGAEEVAEATIRRALAMADAIAAGRTTLQAEADARPELTFLQTVHREPFADDALALREGIVNFTEVRAGDALHAEGHPPLIAPMDGWLLFPKFPPRTADGTYKQPLPGEIYRIVAPLQGHPTEVFAAGIREMELSRDR